MFLSFSFMPCLPIDLKLLYSAVVSMGILCVPFPTIATCLCPVGEPVPFSRVLFPFLVLFSYDVPFLSFPFLSFPFLSFSSMPCLPIDLNHLYSAVVSMGILCVPFPTKATCLCPVGEPVPFSRVLFPFLVLFSYDVPFLSFPFLSFPFLSFPSLPFLSFPFLSFFPFRSFSSMPVYFGPLI